MAVPRDQRLGVALALLFDRALLFDEARLRALVRFHCGYLPDVRHKLEQLAKELAQGVPPSPAASLYRLQRYVSVHTTLAFANWLTGQPRRALMSIEDLLFRTGEARALIGQAEVLALLAMPLAVWSGDMNALERYLKMLIDLQNTESIPLWDPVRSFYEHVARQARGGNEIPAIRWAISDLVRDNFLLRTPMYLGVLAEILLKAEQSSEAQNTIESALAMQQRLKEEWCLPELLRIKANVLSTLGARDSADVLYREALAKAEEQGSALFVLRITNDLAEGLIREGEFMRALDLLATVSHLNCSEEESATEDLRKLGRLIEKAKRSTGQSGAGV